ncbi:unnamed protein product [Brassicogethes aeneus]|uniref:Uncharacterized protein n=1 Tax=Brassicogethes aeneus TaxID=1431903 RepID=A0A9P0AVX1_BRAAE|nr:unnamed protein product [Brassicogethes aeneus]
MATLDLSDDFKISLDSIEEDTDVPWFSLIQNLSNEQLEFLENKFKQKKTQSKEININQEIIDQEGLTKEEFLDVICEIYNNHNYSVQSLILFENISKGEKFRIKWNDFIDFLIANLEPTSPEKLRLTLMHIEPSPQTKVINYKYLLKKSCDFYLLA